MIAGRLNIILFHAANDFAINVSDACRRVLF